jgi:hypothetical protein
MDLTCGAKYQAHMSSASVASDLAPPLSRGVLRPSFHHRHRLEGWPPTLSLSSTLSVGVAPTVSSTLTSSSPPLGDVGCTSSWESCGRDA